MEYFLPMHVYFCCQDDAVVFLDLKNDEYTMLEGIEAAAFRTTLCRRSNPSSRGDSNQRDSTHYLEILGELVRNGLLTTAATSHCKPVLPTVTGTPVEHLIDADAAAVRVQPSHVWRFIVSCTMAALRLRLCHMETTINAVQRRKALRSGGKAFDYDRARQLVVVFNKLRRWFPADYLCLFDSFALIEFLARHEVFPDWIFAVRPSLWAAHCWIQEGNVAFNEDAEATENYIPIMVV